MDCARELLERHGARVETLLTESVEELSACWPPDGDRRVVLVGGDGTLHAVAFSVAMKGARVCHTYCGEGNEQGVAYASTFDPVRCFHQGASARRVERR